MRVLYHVGVYLGNKKVCHISDPKNISDKDSFATVGN
jgi:hypothetical protein